MMLLLSLFLTTLLPSQLKGSEGGGEEGLLPSKVHVAITNFLVHDNLTVHCKDKHNDLGAHTLKAEETYTFVFRPNFFFNVTLYFCRFVWVGASHYFDIYVQDRDKCVECH